MAGYDLGEKKICCASEWPRNASSNALYVVSMGGYEMEEGKDTCCVFLPGYERCGMAFDD